MAIHPRWASIFISCTFIPSLYGQAPQKYALILDDAPLIESFGARTPLQGLQTSGRRASILAKQAILTAELHARRVVVTAAMQHLLNAVFVNAAPDQVPALRVLPGVKGVVPVRRYHAQLNRAVQVVNAPAAWDQLGGMSQAGLGIKIAILDSGIDQTHPTFLDNSLTPPAGFPICPRVSDCAFTTNKVIVARSYVANLATGAGSDPAVNSRPDDYSVRDLVGHGTAVASVAAGESAVGPLATIMGVAPRAFLGNYKIFGSAEINGFTDSSAIGPALEDAVKDGMQIAVLSLGGPAFTGPADTGPACGNAAGVPCDLDSAAVENAIKAGMTVVVAAGNDNGSGSAVSTLDSIDSPGIAASAITVAATTNAHDFSPVIKIDGSNVPGSLQQILENPGDSIAPPSSLTAPLVDVVKAGDALACAALSPVSGKIVLVTRGTCTFAVKAQNVAAAGGVGMIVVNTNDTEVVPMGGLAASPIPVVSIASSDGASLKTLLAGNADLTATLPHYYLEVSAKADVVTSFSSLGPVLGTAGLKPDIAAPGYAIYMAAQNYDLYGDLYSPERYAVADGTSFATPMVAGGAALVLQRHPTFTPSQVKSALVNTADRATVSVFRTADAPGSVLEVGGGRMDAGAALTSSLTVEPASVSFGALPSGAVAQAQSLLLTNFSSAAVALTLSVTRTTADAATQLTVTPASLTIAPNSSATVMLALSGTQPSPGIYEGALEVTGGAAPLHAPYLYVVGDGKAADYIKFNGDGLTGTVGQDLEGGVSFKVVDQYGVPVPALPVAFSMLAGSAGSLKNTDTSTNQFGIAHTDVTLGPNQCLHICAETVNVLVEGQKLTFSNQARPQPTIQDNGITDAASFKPGAIVPGAFISIFGSGLADFADVNGSAVLPLALDTVFVSFDAGSVSVPGRLYYVSGGQVNVQVPWELAGQTSAKIKVTIEDSYGKVVTVPVAAAAPALFAYTDATLNASVAAALDENYTLIGSGNAVARGHMAQLYANALGPVSNTPPSGFPAPTNPLAQTLETPVVTIGTRPAAVQFSGLAPGFAGLYQVNVTVPADIAPGVQPVVITIGGATSPAVNLPVK
ncbi:MAG TPA: hypothetical protein DEQ47_17045 [Solibacterales bacterium]|nr:hypothetical protein [Bryobacterales bacterium]